MNKVKSKIKCKAKSSKGITLIALVITIVVLIILAGVAINLTLSQNGIFNKAKQARDDYQQATTNQFVLCEQRWCCSWWFVYTWSSTLFLFKIQY